MIFEIQRYILSRERIQSQKGLEKRWNFSHFGSHVQSFGHQKLASKNTWKFKLLFERFWAALGRPEARILDACAVDLMSRLLHKVMILSDFGSVLGLLWEAWGHLFGVCCEVLCRSYGNCPGIAAPQPRLKQGRRSKSV